MLQILIDFGQVHLLNGAAVRIYGYGLMMVLGFLFGLALSRRRASRMGENPDQMIYLAILGLVGGIAGARLAYVLHKWESFAREDFAGVWDVSSGGLVYYGGLLGAMLLAIAYIALRRLPMRRMLDILAPAIMLGLAFGRLGCLLNGCCYGGPADEHFPLAARFPMYSTTLVKLDGHPESPFSRATVTPTPPYMAQLNSGRVQPDERLFLQVVGRDLGPELHRPADLHGCLHNDQLTVMFAPREAARKLFMQAAGDDLMTRNEFERARRDGRGLLRGSEFWQEAVTFSGTDRSMGVPPMNRPATLTAQQADALTFDALWSYLQARRGFLLSRFDADGDNRLIGPEAQRANDYLQADLFQLARSERSAPILPAQALGAAGALLLAGLLMALSRLRSREGQVFAAMLIAYPLVRFVEELIRADNPHNLAAWIWTHNQYTSLAMLLTGVAMFVLLRKLPASSGPTWVQRQASAKTD